ncbi:MAG: LysR family transcriptional regulator [Fusicatenibacter sp.]
MFQGMEYVYEVYREKSFSKAARNLFISQPSLSANIRRIEKRIGYPIFDRSTKPLGLTECGVEYIKSIERILAVENDFTEFINDWGNLKKGSLILGGSSLFSSFVLPSLMGQFAAQYPKIQLTLIEENTSKLQEMLLCGRLDLVLDNSIPDRHIFDYCTYGEEHLVLAVPASFPINQKLMEYQVSVDEIRSHNYLDSSIKHVPLNLFREESFVLLKQENDTGKRAIELCHQNGFHPKVVFELDQQLTSYNVTCSGMGISFISDTLISRVTANLDVVYYKLDEKIGTRKLFFYWKAGRYVSRAMDEFLHIVNKQ